MSATPEQIADVVGRYSRDAYSKAKVASRTEGLEHAAPQMFADADHLRAAAALIRAQAERVRVLEAKLQKIAGEAPAKEPSDGPTVAWPPNWSDDLQDVVNDMIIDAFADGYARALWEVGQTADAALTATGAPQ